MKNRGFACAVAMLLATGVIGVSTPVFSQQLNAQNLMEQGKDFLNNYGSEIGLSQDEIENLDVVRNYSGGNSVVSSDVGLIEATSGIQLEMKSPVSGLNETVNLQALISSASNYTEKVRLHNDLIGSMNTVYMAVDIGGDRRDSQEGNFIARRDDILSRMNEVNSAKKTLGSHMYDSGLNMTSAFSAGWGVARNTFLNMKVLEKVDKLDDATQAALIGIELVENIAKLEADIKNIIETNNPNDLVKAAGSLAETINKILPNENSRVSLGTKAVQVAGSLGNIIANINDIKNIKSQLNGATGNAIGISNQALSILARNIVVEFSEISINVLDSVPGAASPAIALKGVVEGDISRRVRSLSSMSERIEKLNDLTDELIRNNKGLINYVDTQIGFKAQSGELDNFVQAANSKQKSAVNDQLDNKKQLAEAVAEQVALQEKIKEKRNELQEQIDQKRGTRDTLFRNRDLLAKNARNNMQRIKSQWNEILVYSKAKGGPGLTEQQRRTIVQLWKAYHNNEKELDSIYENFDSRITEINTEIESLQSEFRSVFASDLAKSMEEVQSLVSDVNDDSKVTTTSSSLDNTVWYSFGGLVGKSATKETGSYTGATYSTTALPKNSGNIQISIKNLSDTVTATSAGYGSYTYTAWGEWDGNNTITYSRPTDGHVFTDIQGHWIYGQVSSSDTINTYGTATYKGEVQGGYVNHNTDFTEPNSITGDFTLNASLANGANSLSGTINLDRNGADYLTGTISTVNARTSTNSTVFTSNITTAGGGTGTMVGSMFGPKAEEVGGSFSLFEDAAQNIGAAGVFRGKKQ